MNDKQCQIGMIGLGVMGCNFAFNMADHGFSVVGYDQDLNKVKDFDENGKGKSVKGAFSLKDFFDSLSLPHIIMMLVPAGAPVDSVINDLIPFLSRGDILIDAGNSNFKDTERRQKVLSEKGLYLLGVGISGGEKGARLGPSLMPGGAKEAYEKVRPIFEATAAHVYGEPCVTYLGTGSVGHYVKMVHNGIEYGLMQLIAEAYDLMKRGLDFNDDQIQATFNQWNQSEIGGFLIEITAEIFNKIDPGTGKRLIDLILSQAEQKGTGLWTSEDAMALHQPLPTIDVAVMMRDLSVLPSKQTVANKEQLIGPKNKYEGNKKLFIDDLKNALCVSMILTYEQGFTMLKVASNHYNFGLNLEKVALIWRGGCIIRSNLLEQFVESYKNDPNLETLLSDSKIGSELSAYQKNLRNIVLEGIKMGVPVPALAISISYYDSYRSHWLPANLIQAQRDFFGSHTYERIDEKGIFHTNWG